LDFTTWYTIKVGDNEYFDQINGCHSGITSWSTFQF
jgi:hypothetical protein